MYKNSEKFLTSFNRIEKELKALMTQRKDFGFKKSVIILQDSNAIIKRYRDDLLEFAELRNAIVHNKIDMAYAIAEPHDSVITKMEEIERELTEPRKVIHSFSRKVFTFQENDLLADMLKVIRTHSFSKFPIFNGKAFKGLITQKGISRWLANNTSNGSLPSMETELAEILKYEGKDNYKFISGEISVFEAVELFRKQIGEGRRLEALLITKSEYSTERLIGIITAFDILEIPYESNN
ncbi:CBS domain-containing protein [Virgibacillus ainsalahensis]